MDWYVFLSLSVFAVAVEQGIILWLLVLLLARRPCRGPK